MYNAGFIYFLWSCVFTGESFDSCKYRRERYCQIIWNPKEPGALTGWNGKGIPKGWEGSFLLLKVEILLILF